VDPTINHLRLPGEFLQAGAYSLTGLCEEGLVFSFRYCPIRAGPVEPVPSQPMKIQSREARETLFVQEGTRLAQLEDTAVHPRTLNQRDVVQRRSAQRQVWHVQERAGPHGGVEGQHLKHPEQGFTPVAKLFTSVPQGLLILNFPVSVSTKCRQIRKRRRHIRP